MFSQLGSQLPKIRAEIKHFTSRGTSNTLNSIQPYTQTFLYSVHARIKAFFYAIHALIEPVFHFAHAKIDAPLNAVGALIKTLFHPYHALQDGFNRRLGNLFVHDFHRVFTIVCRKRHLPMTYNMVQGKCQSFTESALVFQIASALA